MKKFLLTGMILFAAMPVMAEDLYSQLRVVDPVMQNVLNLSQDVPKKVAISYDSPFALYNIAFERFKNSNIKPAYDDFKNLFENAQANDYFYMKMAEEMAKIGFYSLSDLAMSKIKEKDIANIVVEDIKHYYFPAQQMRQKKELYFAELYSNIVYNEQTAEVINEFNRGDNSLDGIDYANYLQAFAFVKNNDFVNAKTYIDKAVYLNPDNLNYQALQVEILAETNQAKEALKIINKLKKQQIYSVTFVNKINSLEQYVKYKLAKNEPAKSYHLGYYYYWEKAYEKAIRTLSAIEKKNKDVNALLARIYYDTQDYDKAYSVASKAKASALANEVLGDYYTDKKEFASALKCYSKACMQDKKQLKYREKLAQCYLALGQTNKAKGLFEDVIVNSSNAYLSYYNLAQLDSAKELPYLKKSVAINMMFVDGWLSLAETELRKENLDSAGKYLKIVKSIDENHFKYYYYLGLLCNKQGQKHDAAQNFQKALLLNPDFEPAKEALSI
ncbi:MAG: tetratricopeptide repeat protein [Fusobacterium sp.]|nr:tetratricopeptide repeat protein [Fusobacterium sp.]